MKTLDITVAKRVLEVVDAGLCNGVGRPEPGFMCVEAAVCYALDEPHGDDPSCVGAAVRAFKIGLNDCNWPSKAARAEGMREIAIAQLGSDQIDQVEFARYVALETVRQVLPITLRAAGLEEHAAKCEQAADLEAARDAASEASYAARDAASEASYAARDAASWAARAASWAASEAASEAARDAARAARAASWAASVNIYKVAAKIGVAALRHLKCLGVEFLDQLLD